jgi:molybdopterin-guanine dinucleotide biosynthesis protein A
MKAATTLTGIVACGGQSLRMGKDKSLMMYFGKPQWLYLAQLLSPFCDDVFISCNAGQAENIPANFKCIIDAPAFAGIGPMASVLSPFNEMPDVSLLVVGCDYPLVSREHLQQLVHARQPDMDAVCFASPEKNILEPLITIYENSSKALLMRNFKRKQYSLRHALGELRSIQIIPSSFDSLTSVDDQAGYEIMKKVLANKI